MSDRDSIAAKLAKLREPFQPNQIGKLPKPTKAQTEAVRQDFRKGIRCQLCGTWHHPDVIHLDYVGHAALTDRLLDVDPFWTWEPLSTDERGLPLFDEHGGLWIKLTVLGITRLGYGHADGKAGGDAIKEIVGDCLRNAAMRFGAALEFWHKGELHMADNEPADQQESARPKKPAYTDEQIAKNRDQWIDLIESGKKTADQIIAAIETKATLTDEQRLAIRQLGAATEEQEMDGEH